MSDDHSSHKSTEELEKELFDLRQLLEISKSLSSNLDYVSLMDSILYICMGQMRVTQAAIFSRDNLEFPGFKLMRNQEGFDLDADQQYILDAQSTLTTFLFHHPRCFTPQELHELVDDEESFAVLDSLHPTLIVPLKVKDQLTGVLLLGERIGRDEYSPKERQYLLDIAHFASIAVHNAILFEMSTTDMMTHLKLRHYFFAVLNERIQNAGDRRPFSLIMFDLDHFKMVNDTHGHQAGDEVLRAVSHIIRAKLRQRDIGARYGGEEFIILLPGTGESTAYKIAERLRKQIAACGKKELDGVDSITVSAGVAEFDPALDKNADALISRLDEALYYSKNAGRNRTTKSSSLDNGSSIQNN
jgi:diguanylate cyclase (GGDEF)-like protein